uniref:Protein E6 n=1 Tax=Human papillomavirus TaxID=10566 RepID=A0A385PLB5_9PAPI|nr:MAG: E6 protein [Human papillomavirus]
MASLPPTRLNEYCRLHNINFFDLRLLCVFCKFVCSPEDLAAFFTKNLSLVYKCNIAYACCLKCLKLTANYERERYSQCIVKSSVIDAVAGKCLEDLIVRCLYCYALLDVLEKKECLNRDEDIHLVRGHWRSSCRNCFSVQYEG